MVAIMYMLRRYVRVDCIVNFKILNIGIFNSIL